MDINFYASGDDYIGEIMDDDEYSALSIFDKAKWGNRAGSLNYKTNLKPSWFSNSIVSASRFTNNEELSIIQDFHNGGIVIGPFSRGVETIYYNSKIESSIDDFTLKSHHEFELDSLNTIMAGVEINYLLTNYQSVQDYLKMFGDSIAFNEALSSDALISSVYGSYKLKKSGINSTIGVRATYYEPNNTFHFEPRLQLGISINEHFKLKSAASLHHQFVNRAIQPHFQDNSKHYWVLADNKSVPVLKSYHLIVGGTYSKKRWTVDLEYYYKQTDGGSLKNNFFLNLTELQNDNLPIMNISNGLDLFIKYNGEKFSSWVSYSLSNSTNAFTYNSEEHLYPSSYDQLHEAKLVNLLKVKRWEFSTMLIYGSGKPYSVPTLDNYDASYDLSQLNNQRLPAYLRIDLSAKYSFQLSKMKCEAGLSLFNVLNYQNKKSRQSIPRHVSSDGDSYVISSNASLVTYDYNFLGLTPNLFFNIRF